ncbi:MAG: hypothetical protein WDN47_05060 [Candidatus Doudnabacteria bacterium]
MIISGITLENLDKIDLSQLRDPNFFSKVEDFVYGLDAEGSPDNARVVFLSLTDLISKADDNRETLAKKYFPILCALRLIGLSSVSDQEKESFISQNLTVLLNQDYADLKYWLNFLFVSYGYDEELSKNLQNLFISAISQSNSRIGDKDMRISTGLVKPFVKNWIYDYNGSSLTYQSKKTVADETSYTNQSPNAKLLSKLERITLLKLLRLYDWLRFDAVKPKLEVEEPALPAEILITSVNYPPVAPGVAAKPVPAKPVSDFDKKLAGVAASTAHGQDLEVIRKQMEPKQANPAPSLRTFEKTAPPLAPAEIRREVGTQELQAHQETVRPVFKPAPVAPAPRPIAPKPAASIYPSSLPTPPPPVRRLDETPYQLGGEAKIGLHSLDKINVIEDLKKVDVSVLREGPVDVQTQALRSKILNLANANKILPYYTVNAFEQSPLFNAYLEIGSAIIADNSSDRKAAFKVAAAKVGSQLTFQEFEAIADLKKEIERL